MALEQVLAGGGDVAWEWPSGASLGWKSKAIRRLETTLRRYGKGVFYARFDGCQYGLEFGGRPLLKKWTVLTSSKDLWTALSRRCGGSCGDHAECRGPAAQASAYYPVSMCQAVVKAMRHQWNAAEAHWVEQVLEPQVMDPDGRSSLTAVYALSRTRIHADQAPTGRRLEAVKQMMMRVHRSSGHSGFSNLQRAGCDQSGCSSPIPPRGARPGSVQGHVHALGADDQGVRAGESSLGGAGFSSAPPDGG